MPGSLPALGTVAADAACCPSNPTRHVADMAAVCLRKALLVLSIVSPRTPRPRLIYEETPGQRVYAIAGRRALTVHFRWPAAGAKVCKPEGIGQGQLHNLKNRALPRIEVAFQSQNHLSVCQSSDSLNCRWRLARPHR